MYSLPFKILIHLNYFTEREDDILFIFQDIRRKGCSSRIEERCGVERCVRLCSFGEKRKKKRVVARSKRRFRLSIFSNPSKRIYSGTLQSVDQFLNIKLHDIDVVDKKRYPQLLSVKNCFIRGSVVRYIQMSPGDVDTELLQDAARREHEKKQ